jgi:hypothetical protein
MHTRYVMMALVLLCSGTPVITQEVIRDSQAVAPVRNVAEAFRHGHFGGGFRTFLMVTDNARDLTDYYALAAGGSLEYTTAPLYGVSMGISGAFNYNLAASDLGARDPKTGAVNRYEIGLFDVEDPYNKRDLDRLEALWLRYARGGTRLTVGNQLIQTPLINHQDGRMRPTVVSGLWMERRFSANWHAEGGWLWSMSPRSTVRWYDLGTSIGLYPRGLNPDGTASGYPEQLKTAGAGLIGITRTWGTRLKVQVWDQFVENIFNTAMVQADYAYPLPAGNRILAGLMVLRQDALADGGNPEQDKTYFLRGSKAHIWSAQAGWERGEWRTLVAYTRVTPDGRFLSPREWGREPFYTFMSRERIEGSGDTHSATARVRWRHPSNRFSLETGYGHFYLPDVQASALSKYGFPAFRQFNMEVRYQFGGAWKGLQAQMLYVWKGRLGEVYGQDRYVINRVDMSQYNLVLNYTY